MIETVPLENGFFYHVYNRGNNKELLFREEMNYHYFLTLIKKYILPIADVYAYCLLGNHFHLMIRVKDITNSLPEQCFSNFFNTYVKAFNKKYNRTGKLFSERFKKKKITDDMYFTDIVYYIHANPQLHSVVKDFRKYRHSSYQGMLSNGKTDLKRNELLEWFGGKELFEKYHNDRYSLINENFLFEDFD